MTSPSPLPALDVSIVTYNAARWIGPFLDSLLAQRYPADRLTLLVRDNGSTPPEYAAVRAAVDRVATAFAAVRIERGDNVGFGRGHNDNFTRGAAPYFLVANVDLAFGPDAVITAVQALAADAPAVACREFRQQPYEHPKHYHPATLETAWCSSACIVFRRDALAAVGGYEERIFLYGEDVELSFRLRDRGYVLKYCPAAVVTHHSYAHAGQVKAEQYFGSTSANWVLRLRYGSALQILIGVVLQLSLWLRWPRYPQYYRRLAESLARALRDTPYFLRTRKKSAQSFPFRLWGYGVRRHGAFHVAPPVSGNPRVSIIVRTHAARLGWLREALASIAHQTYRNVELVVVEDGGDAARAMVERAGATGCFAAVVYRAIPKSGRVGAGNAGLALATGAFIGFLDDDDLLYADHVETLLGALQAQPQLAAVYGSALEIPARVVTEDPWRYVELAPTLSRGGPFSREALWQGNYIAIQSVLFRRDCYERHGGFDPELENQEDWNLWTRYALDRDFGFVAKTTSLYRVPADAVQFLRRACVLEHYRASALARRPRCDGAVAGSSSSPTLSAAGALRILEALPFLRPWFLPTRRIVAWVRGRRGR